MRIFNALLCVVGVATMFASPALAQSSLADFYRTCLASGGVPVNFSATEGSFSFDATRAAPSVAREMLITVTVASGATGKYTVSRDQAFYGGASGIILGGGGAIAFLATRATVVPRPPASGAAEICVRVSAP